MRERRRRSLALGIVVGVVVAALGAAVWWSAPTAAQPAAHPPTPTPTPDPTAAAQPRARLAPTARAVVSRREGVPVDQLAVGTSTTAHYPLHGTTAHTFKVHDTRPTGTVYGVTLDEQGRDLDERQLAAAEQATARARYGNAAPRLAEVLAAARPDQRIPVRLWLRPGECPRPPQPAVSAPSVAVGSGQPTATPLPREQVEVTAQPAPAARATSEAFSQVARAASEACTRAAVAPVVERLGRRGYTATAPGGAPELRAVLPAAVVREVAGWAEVRTVSLDEAAYHRGGYAGTPTLLPATPTAPPGAKRLAVASLAKGEGGGSLAGVGGPAPTVFAVRDLRDAAELGHAELIRRAARADFTREALFAVFGPRIGSSGYGITVEDVRATAREVWLVARLSRPAPWQFSSDVVTRAYHLVAVPRGELPPAPDAVHLVDAATGAVLARAPSPPSARPPAPQAATRSADPGACGHARLRALTEQFVHAYTAHDVATLLGLLDPDHPMFAYHDAMTGTPPAAPVAADRLWNRSNLPAWQLYLQARFALDDRLDLVEDAAVVFLQPDGPRPTGHAEARLTRSWSGPTGRETGTGLLSIGCHAGRLTWVGFYADAP